MEWKYAKHTSEIEKLKYQFCEPIENASDWKSWGIYYHPALFAFLRVMETEIIKQFRAAFYRPLDVPDGDQHVLLD
jgi:hypothetical protein